MSAPRGVWSGGVSAPGGVCSGMVCVCSQGGLVRGGCLLPGGSGLGGGIPACTEADTPPPPPPREQNDKQV